MRPAPGTPEFNEQQDKQGQAAMDAVLAHPAARLFFGALFLMMLFAFFVIYETQLFGQEPLWQKIVAAICMPLIFGPMLTELGSVTLFGRSLTPWYRVLIRRWRPKD